MAFCTVFALHKFLPLIVVVLKGLAMNHIAIMEWKIIVVK